uniref:Carbohydrate sulfotransferase n=1 Tax=Gopherus agassizii TaxID=38772 RepID=A0A452GQV4_9SAUR
MKQALMEVMRMNRICRMVLVTCFGSFILVIFYFQSMLHPGRAPPGVNLCCGPGRSGRERGWGRRWQRASRWWAASGAQQLLLLPAPYP